MKRFGIIYFIMIIFVVAVFAGVNISLSTDSTKTEKARNVIVNRLTYSIQTDYYIGSDIDSIIDENYHNKLDVLKKEYRAYEIPSDICFIGVNNDESSQLLFEVGDKRITSIKEESGEIAGFLVFAFDTYISNNIVIYVNVGMAVCSLVLFAFVLYIQMQVLEPFNQISSYPEQLSKGEITDKIPESKNKYFGRFIWGINMLSDKLSGDKKRINKLMQERQVMLTTIAHGIKTPVANIKLYASAIEMGLYQEDGIPDKKDAEIAAKIDKNADDITLLVKEMIETTATGMVDFIASPAKFYINEIVEFINQEYSNRLAMLHIPCKIDCSTEAMIDTDKSGLIRILSQIMDNAIKYGDGSGISIIIEKQDEGFFLSIKNKGKLISEQEIPYIFNSFWRGSNSELAEGSGIGMFEAKQIARKLGGDIYVKRYEETSEMEFVLYIP